MSFSAVVDAQSCHGCQRIKTEMEINITKLSEMITELNERVNQINKQKTIKSSFWQSNKMFTDKRLLRIKAAAFITGRQLTAHRCKQLVLNLYDNKPPYMFNGDHIKSINDNRECHDPNLSASGPYLNCSAWRS